MAVIIPIKRVSGGGTSTTGLAEAAAADTLGHSLLPAGTGNWASGAGSTITITGSWSVAEDLTTAAGRFWGWLTRSRLRSPSDGVITLLNLAETAFTRLQLGGTGAGFPALARSAAELHVKLADDSDFATLRAEKLLAETRALIGTTTETNMADGDARMTGALWIGDGITAPTAQAGFAAIYVDTADGDLKIKFGDGFVRVLGADS